MKTFLLLVLLSALAATQAAVMRRHKRNILPFDREGPTKASEAEDMKKPGFEDFKNLVMGTLTNDGMKTDSFLAKVWKRADYNVEAAADLIKKTLDRRAELKMDGITKEKFDSDLAKIDYKETEFDKLNRPIFFFDGAKTSLRAEIESSEKRNAEMHRAFMYTYQRSADRALKNADYPQMTIVINYKGWTVAEGGCAPHCLDFVRKIAEDYEIMFPGFVYRAALINTDLGFDVLFNIIKLALHKDNRDNLYSFVTEVQWRPALSKVVDDAVINKLIGA